VVRYIDYQDIFFDKMLSKIIIHISLVLHSTRSVLILLESGFHYTTTAGMLEIAQRIILVYLLQLMLREVSQNQRFIGRLSTYRKIIGGSQNIDNWYR
jgi:hypothetical protein